MQANILKLPPAGKKQELKLLSIFLLKNNCFPIPLFGNLHCTNQAKYTWPPTQRDSFHTTFMPYCFYECFLQYF